MIANIIRNAKKTVTGGDPYYSAVSLLLPMDGTNGSTTFTDSSLNALTVTAVGNAQISTTQSKYGGASAYFDGTGDYLSSTSTQLDFSTGDFTIEFWFYASSTSGTQMLFESGTGASNDLQILIYNGTVSFGVGGGSKTVSLSVSGLQWNHIACVKSGTSLFFFLNGSVSSSTTQTINSKTAVYIGSRSNGSISFNGYIDDLRISKFARYTSTFTPPTAALPTTASSTPADPYYGYTSLLLHMGGANASTNFVDSGPNALAVTASGNAQISTTQSKYGGASASLNASTNTYLSIADNDTFYMPADFTIEAWVWIDGGTNAIQAIYSQRQSGSNGFQATITYNAGVYQTWMWIDSTHIFTYQSGSSIPTSQWVHLAWTRSGTTFRSFINGVLNQTSTSSIAPINQAAPVIIGEAPGYSQIFKGYIDDLRVTKYARYQSSFTPPTQALPNIYNPYTTLPVSGAALWLDASQQNTIFSDAGTTPVTTSGQSIYQWNDLSGNNRHAVQATSGNRPTWVPPASGQNGFGVVNFTGSPVRMTGSSLGLSSTATYIGVIKTSGTNGKLINYWLSIYSGTSWHALRVGGVYNDSTNGAYSLAYTESSALSNFGTNANSYTVADDSIANMIAYVYDKNSSSNNKIYKNNASQSLINNLISNSIPSGNYMLGMRSDLAWDVDARFCEVIVYPTALSSGDLTTMYSYLKTKWGTP